MKNLHGISRLALMSVLALSTPTYAQTSDAQENNEDQDNTDTIVVTGRFQQSLIDRIPIAPQELPFSLDVINRELLDELNYTRPLDALTTLPNVTIITDRLGTGTPRFFARGFEAPTLVDNRQQNSFRGSGARDDSFVDRYEVLRGPASITLGPVGSGGVFNTITKSPENEDFIAGKLRFDHFGSMGAEFDINGAELFGSDVISARMSGAVRDFNYDAELAQRKNYAIRPVVVFDFSEDTSAKFSTSYVRQDANPNRGFPLNADGSIPMEITTKSFTSYANGDGRTEDLYVDANLEHNFLDNLKLTLRGSHQDTDFNYQNTSGLYKYRFGFTSADDRDAYAYSQRAVTKSKNTFIDAQLAVDFDWGGREQNFVIAASYNDDSFNRMFSDYTYQAYNLADIDVPRFGDATATDEVFPHTESEGTLYSVLAEAALRPADWVTFVGGVRYDDVDQTFTRFRGGNAFESGLKDDSITFRVGSSVALNESFNVYASYAEAFTPQSGNRLDGSPVEPETTEGFEIGIKGSAIEDRLSFTAAYFNTDRSNVAVSFFTPEEAVYYETIGKARAQGFEITTNFEPFSGFNMGVNYGYTDSDVIEAGDFGDVTSTAFPKHTASAHFSYEVQDGALEGLTLGGNVRNVGSRESIVADAIFDGYTVIDLNASMPIDDNFNIALNVINLGDKLYLESNGEITGRVTGLSRLGAPRTVVATVSGRF